MKTKNILIIASILGLILCVAYSLYQTNELNNKLKAFDNSEWVCIAQGCINNYTEDEWVKKNCYLEGNNMTCSFNWNNQDYDFLLSNINVTYMLNNKVGKYCELKCQTEVLIKLYGE
jgi:hypothetical protein